jgi:methionyl-tRNA formyltransferase
MCNSKYFQRLPLPAAEPAPGKQIRIAVFGSFYRGFYVLDELLHGPLRSLFSVVGVATDDVNETFVSRDKRVWQYPHSEAERTLVETTAQQHGLPVFKARVKTEAFYTLYEREWRPDICVSATFGQRLDERIFCQPKFGFFNLHPCIADGWPSRYAGPNPFRGLMDDGIDHTLTALHRVDAGLDTGELLGYSPRIAIPQGASVVDMHKISSPVIAKFAVPELARLAGLGAEVQQLQPASAMETWNAGI